jgi:hypothetical protein
MRLRTIVLSLLFLWSGLIAVWQWRELQAPMTQTRYEELCRGSDPGIQCLPEIGFAITAVAAGIIALVSGLKLMSRFLAWAREGEPSAAQRFGRYLRR